MYYCHILTLIKYCWNYFFLIDRSTIFFYFATEFEYTTFALKRLPIYFVVVDQRLILCNRMIPKLLVAGWVLFHCIIRLLIYFTSIIYVVIDATNYRHHFLIVKMVKYPYGIKGCLLCYGKLHSRELIND